jgi:hypothetical protein
MALDSYTALQAAVASWLARSNLTAQIPDFVALAEAKLNRTLRVRQMEQRSTATATEYMALPANFLEMRDIQLNQTPKVALELVSPDEIDRNYSSISGQPAVYAIVANQIQLGPSPDGAYTVEIDYWESLPPLASNSTNWLLAAAPDVYLYGTCLEAAAFMADDPRVPGWQQAFSACVEQLQSADKRARWSGSRLRVRPA